MVARVDVFLVGQEKPASYIVMETNHVWLADGFLHIKINSVDTNSHNCMQIKGFNIKEGE